MSVINKMLKDLDKRGAAPGGLERTAREAAPPPSPLVRGASGKNFAAWTLIAVVAIGAVSLALWLWPEATDEHAKKGEPAKLAELKPVPAPQAPSAAVTAGETKPAESAPKPAAESPAKDTTVAAAPAAPTTAASPTPVAPTAPAEKTAVPAEPAASTPTAPVSPVAPAAPVATPAPAPSTGVAIVPTPAPSAEKASKEQPKVTEAAPPAAAPAKQPAVVAQASVAPRSEPPKSAARREEPKAERRAPERKEGSISITKRPAAEPFAAAEGKSTSKESLKSAAAKPSPAAKRKTREPTPTVAAATPAGDTAKAGASAQDTTKGTISIERADSSRSDLATREFRSAMDLMNQGRVELALSTFAGALRQDPKHVAARQAMVVLLMERGRTAEAETVLRDGLQALPEHTAWAMLLARIQVQAGDLAGAADTLERALPYAKDRADYHGFYGTVLQMQSRHKDAIAHYEIAARLSPGSGRYLTGLAISLEEEKRVPEARDAYSRALATKSLGPDLQAFIERKLAELR